MTTQTDVALRGQHSTGKRKQRNSSIELLRIIAMLMILSHHFVVHNGSPLSRFPLTPGREIFSFFFLSGGKIGVVIFFSISAWFFIDSAQSIKQNFKRIWLMERELLFWSLTLLAAFAIINRSTFPSIVITSFFPIVTNLWWYATSYAAFLALLPFLQYALLAMGRKRHIQLTVMLLAVFAPLSLIPLQTIFPLFINNVAGFVYMFIILSCYKLYIKPASTKRLWGTISIGLGLSIAIIIFLDLAIKYLFNNTPPAVLDNYSPFSDFALPTMLVGIPIFLLFSRAHFHNSIINFIAKSAFAVYLISDYPLTQNLLWSTWFNLKDIYGKPFMVLHVIGILLGVYAACILCDFIRRGLFALTVDRHPGRWFNALWDTVAHWHWVQSLPKLMLKPSASDTADSPQAAQIK